jgi:hypothetical protein
MVGTVEETEPAYSVLQLPSGTHQLTVALPGCTSAAGVIAEQLSDDGGAALLVHVPSRFRLQVLPPAPTPPENALLRFLTCASPAVSAVANGRRRWDSA